MLLAHEVAHNYYFVLPKWVQNWNKNNFKLEICNPLVEIRKYKESFCFRANSIKNQKYFFEKQKLVIQKDVCILWSKRIGQESLSLCWQYSTISVPSREQCLELAGSGTGSRVIWCKRANIFPVSGAQPVITASIVCKWSWKMLLVLDESRVLRLRRLNGRVPVLST